MRFRSALICVLVGLLIAPSAHAQGQQDLWRQFATRLTPGSFIVVHLRNGASVEGRLIEVTPEVLRVLPKTRLAVPARALPFDAIVSIDARKEGISPGAKVLTGIAIGGGVLLLLTALAFGASG
jgi:hypothetical protein